MITGTFLDRILAKTREELAERQRRLPLPDLRRRLVEAPPPTNVARALAPGRLHLIAEVKRASPSRGVFVQNLDVRTLARAYVENGASALSVLTDAPFFHGSLEDMAAAREIAGPASVPVLRKDFIVDPYQVYEARVWAADIVLLIAVCLEGAALRDLREMAEGLGMAALVEVHDEAEVERALKSGATLIGVNNRDLRTFVTDLSVTERLIPYVSAPAIAVAESGILTRADAERMARAGGRAILVGEALITASDTAAKVRELSGVATVSRP